MMPVYYETFKQFRKMLVQLDKWIQKAALYAQEKKFESNLYIGFRLAPNQFSFGEQVQRTCDTAKQGVSRLTGTEPPYQQGREHTLEELRARILVVIKYIDEFSRLEFDDVIDRTVSLPRWEGKYLEAHEYFIEHLIPDFYFHLVLSYEILRHNGVPLTKRDYQGEFQLRPPKPRPRIRR
jgi:uncharacterized protein